MRGLLDTHTATIDWGDGTRSRRGRSAPTGRRVDTLRRDGGGSHVYADDGVYTVTVTVTDDDGGVDADTLTVTVTNVAPVTSMRVSIRRSMRVTRWSWIRRRSPMPGTLDTHTATIDWGDGTASSRGGDRDADGSSGFDDAGVGHGGGFACVCR